jgi:hypothetical protein
VLDKQESAQHLGHVGLLGDTRPPAAEWGMDGMSGAFSSPAQSKSMPQDLLYLRPEMRDMFHP